MKNKWTWVGIIVLVVAVAGGVWAFSQRENPELARARDASKKAMEAFSNDNLSADEKMKLMEQSREAAKNLSEDQRREIRREGWKARSGEMMKRIDEFLAIEDDNSRNEFLDREIDRFQEMRDQWREMRKKRESENEANGQSNREGDRGRGGWGRVQPGDKEGMLNRQRGMLDRSSPEQRAKFTEYFTAIKARMEARGMDTSWGRR